jgi:hypothetical protein
VELDVGREVGEACEPDQRRIADQRKQGGRDQ